MQKIELQAEPREVLGKQTKNLRRQGITPVHIYGHGVDSLALQCDSLKLERVMAVAEENRIITLKIKNEKADRPVLTREVQRDALNGKLIHVDFYQVRMDEKVEVQVPIDLIGEAPALTEKENSLLQELHELGVECLPGNIPANIEIDISVLTEAGQAIRVKDIKLPSGVTVLTDEDTIIANIIVRAKEKVVEEEKPEAEAEGAPAAEGAAAGEKPKAEAPAKESKEKESK
ncbi:MAG: 50S ribosomal protein L25 [Dehalococcoidales bacterium]|nr:50S ribosomal protein L25 [Dehalococcoidales bacterium]